MGDSPFYDGLPGRRAGRTTAGPRVHGRAFRCRAAPRRRREAPLYRYTDFVSLHATADPHEPDLRRLWWSGVACASGATALAAASVLLLRGPFGLQVPAFADGSSNTAALGYGICAGALTLQATALLHVLLATAAHPVRAFCWIGGIVVTLMTLLPFTLHRPLADAAGTALLNLVGGGGVIALLALSAAFARGHRPDPFEDPFGDPFGDVPGGPPPGWR
ncbi:DUF6069 family protein [Actinomadura parmotrematis]|uniref:DUF4383 domain-containing protein n=1 Tax=Actinomadura parmotrematis TaxID=2864039 RepID=A0ABS7FWH6_9ACTN|nr:DUF6069 family protein [Actinomadura parmotrematis]MBW8484791.1 hypothetical protein [Actinomadura parmotrematis]